jgi:Family of unknown function (DUF6158)
MSEIRGKPATELSDEELEHQGRQAHATRHWVFLHGTAEQFEHHTERMLELEQEYLRRHPKRTWQGAGGGAAGGDSADSAAARDLRLRQLLRSFTEQIEALLGEEPEPAAAPAGPGAAERALLERFAAADGGRLHKLEAHQVARALGVSPAAVAGLYRHDPPLLATSGPDRVLTDAGRDFLAAGG